MAEHDPGPHGEPASPGKMRTWWHPLLVRLLEWLLRDAYEVRDEVSVGTVPLRADIVLIRREEGELSADARRELHALVERLNRWSLIEFKSPVDALEGGDLDQLFGVAHLFCAQQSEPIASRDLSLIVLAPSLNQPFRSAVELRGLSVHEEEPGIHRIDGALFTTWVIETDRVTGPGEPVLSLFSRLVLRQRRRIIDQLSESGHEIMLHYVLQQIRQFQGLGEAFAMQHRSVENMEDFKAAVMRSFPAEDRLQGLSAEEVLRHFPAEELLRGLSAEEVLRHFPAEERLQGLPAEDILAGLSPEQRDRLRRLLEQQSDTDS
ncbi:MAG: hypothetical protein ACREJB_14085 [Planctomycetaceae bacterium]